MKSLLMVIGFLVVMGILTWIGFEGVLGLIAFGFVIFWVVSIVGEVVDHARRRWAQRRRRHT